MRDVGVVAHSLNLIYNLTEVQCLQPTSTKFTYVHYINLRTTYLALLLHIQVELELTKDGWEYRWTCFGVRVPMTIQL